MTELTSTTASAGPAGRPTGHAQSDREHRSGLLFALLAATMIGTISNNILSVPLRQITEEFGAPLSQGVLVVSSFVVVLAVAMPVGGWVGDRMGRRRLLLAALALMALGGAGAGVAPTLPVLVVFRAVQGLACAAIPPSVMGMLAQTYGPTRRARMMSAWAAANGCGQALGPPVGGLLADLLGWRSIFAALVPVTLAILAATVRFVPDDRGRPATLHWAGAASLTAGSALLLVAVTAVPQSSVPVWVDVGLAALGALLLAVFMISSSASPHPMVRPRALVEPRFLRSTTAVFVQMACLGAVLVAVPLYGTDVLGVTTAVTGALVFALPASMALLAPVAGRLTERTSPRWVLRGGLALLAVTELLLCVYTSAHSHRLATLVVILVVVGAGVAFVQTPAASGATRSPAGQAGAALGIFNMMRFAGTALGAAWVAVTYPGGHFLALYGGCAGLAGLGLLASFTGHNPHDPDAAPAVPTAPTGEVTPA